QGARRATPARGRTRGLRLPEQRGELPFGPRHLLRLLLRLPLLRGLRAAAAPLARPPRRARALGAARAARRRLARLPARALAERRFGRVPHQRRLARRLARRLRALEAARDVSPGRGNSRRKCG